MSLCIVCPSCKETVTFHFGDVTACPHCGAAFDEKLQKVATANLASQQIRRPVPITIGGVLVTIGFGGAVLVILMVALDVGTYTINDELVSGREFMRYAGVSLFVSGLLNAILTYAIWTERDWGRVLMLMSWVVGWAAWNVPHWGTLTAADMAFSTIFNSCAFGLSAWYLYGSESVKAYYRVLEMKSEANSIENK